MATKTVEYLTTKRDNPLTVNANTATVLGSNPVSDDTVIVECSPNRLYTVYTY